MAEEKTAQAASGGAGAAKAKKKEKPPAIEDKPFAEFIEQHLIPALADALKDEGIEGVDLNFQKSQLPVQGADTSEQYWQLQGHWPAGAARQFGIVFAKEDIKGPKFFYCTQGTTPSSTVEQFMGDERRINLGLMVLYTLQRLNGQKWLTRN